MPHYLVDDNQIVQHIEHGSRDQWVKGFPDPLPEGWEVKHSPYDIKVGKKFAHPEERNR